jgi:hypothetical protein
LSQCAHCREQLAMMVRAEEQPATVAHRSWLWDWHLLASAAAALLILAVGGVRRPAPPQVSSAADKPLVAMSRPEQAPVQQPEQYVQQPPAPSQQPRDLAPPALPEALAAPEALNRAAAKSQSATSKESGTPNNEMHAQPLNGRNYDNSLKLESEASSANMPGRSVKEKKSEKAVPRVSAPSPQTSILMSAARGPASADSDANEAKTAGAFGAKQMESAPRAKAFGVAGAAVAQLAQQRSESTIIQTPDPKVMWRIAGGNFVERTQDGGASWHGQVADPDVLLTSGSAPTTKICWLVGKAGMILITKDTMHWKRIPPPVPADFVAINAKNGSSSTVVAADGQKFSTDNEGKKWIPVR